MSRTASRHRTAHVIVASASPPFLQGREASKRIRVCTDASHRPASVTTRGARERPPGRASRRGQPEGQEQLGQFVHMLTGDRRRFSRLVARRDDRCSTVPRRCRTSEGSRPPRGFDVRRGACPSAERVTKGGKSMQYPERRLLISVDMERYSRRSNLQQYEAQRHFRDPAARGGGDVGLDRVAWITQQAGDGELAIVPREVSSLVSSAGSCRELNRRLRTFNSSRSPLRDRSGCGGRAPGAGAPGRGERLPRPRRRASSAGCATPIPCGRRWPPFPRRGSRLSSRRRCSGTWSASIRRRLRPERFVSRHLIGCCIERSRRLGCGRTDPPRI